MLGHKITRYLGNVMSLERQGGVCTIKVQLDHGSVYERTFYDQWTTPLGTELARPVQSFGEPDDQACSGDATGSGRDSAAARGAAVALLC